MISNDMFIGNLLSPCMCTLIIHLADPKNKSLWPSDCLHKDGMKLPVCHIWAFIGNRETISVM